MTDNGDDDNKTVLIAGLILAVFVILTIVLLMLVLASPFFTTFSQFVALFSDSLESNEAVSCSVHEDHNRYMKEDWLLSSNISSYEDISGNERDNLSTQAREWLTSEKMHEYNPIKYSELSEGEGNLFKRAVDSSTTFNRSNVFWDEDLTDLNFVYYNGTMYHCDILKPSQDA